ncbi:uncharacterized protein BCR38DRAFT_428640 [Pseudomassariella vexata]|uniref:RED-like N-terminal domain-containing protein n=1 Tax=Pseudomassariella vexata TaxID=1141098 RepID=A0A1Y2E2V5_9PEZI|nr:uncharacterized protein BCR38DRAFT_428640 [Pseudomassariella vexata]ORY65881.1 hypothetical protein BCR38DRAFT_428640 [Pseudomassariella vexata]
MNNEQFRRLIGADTPKPKADSNGASPARPRAAVALGSKQKSSIPMTPRSISFGRSDFQRQLAERNRGQKQQQKKPRSSAPKGIKLAEGYIDRTKERANEEADERAVRIKALEEALKKEEIDQAAFDKLQSQIAGGDLSSTHLIKGLDSKLLERIRKGENVYGESKEQEEESEPQDVDDAFEELEEAKIEAVAKEKARKKGQLATTTLKPGQKRTRDMILAEMKAARDAAKAKEESALGSKFRKIGAKAPGTRIERDSKGREVLIIVDEDGHEKRKVRKVQPETAAEVEAKEKEREMMMPDKDAKPLGMEVPDIYKPKDEELKDDEIDIFDDVGDDYDPLAGLDEDSDEDEDGDAKTSKAEKAQDDTDVMPPPSKLAAPSEPRNYFKDSKSGLVSSEILKAPSMSDPAIQAAFKRAAAINAPKASDEDDDDEEAKARAERHRKMLQNDDRDAADLDMGFGTSRFEDEADFDETEIKLSQWGNDEDDGGDGAAGGRKAKRKRGGKKRKGDVNNAGDVMRVMEQQKAAKKS